MVQDLSDEKTSLEQKPPPKNNAPVSTTVEPLLPIAFRNPGPDDWPFIYSYWIDSYRNYLRQDRRRLLTKADMRAHLVGLIARPTTALRVAYDPTDPTFLYGFICGEPSRSILHYCYVKKIYRHQGIGRQLLAALEAFTTFPIQCSHWSSTVDKILAKNPGAFEKYGVKQD